MTPGDIARVLAKAAAFDQRTVGASDVAAWHEALGDIDLTDALEAVTRHYRTDDRRIMPVHIRRITADIDRERRRAAREAREQAEAAVAAIGRGPVEDRTADVVDLVHRMRNKLTASDPDVLRRREWVVAERNRRRAERARAEPNPLYTGPPPPGGHPIPTEGSA